MVKYVIAEQLIGKEVVTNDGMDLGRFLDVEMNEVTGKLMSLILEPNADNEFVKKLDVKDGKLKVPYASVAGGQRLHSHRQEGRSLRRVPS